MKYKVRYFKPVEFRCKCCGQGGVSPLLVFYLDMLRATWGNPIYVTSGYRCPKHNKEVGGAEKSRHMIGAAADLQVMGPDQDVFAAFVKRACNLPYWEVKVGKNYVHLAVPRMEVTEIWSGGVLTIYAGLEDLLSPDAMRAYREVKDNEDAQNAVGKYAFTV